MVGVWPLLKVRASSAVSSDFVFAIRYHENTVESPLWQAINCPNPTDATQKVLWKKDSTSCCSLDSTTQLWTQKPGGGQPATQLLLQHIALENEISTWELQLGSSIQANLSRKTAEGKEVQQCTRPKHRYKCSYEWWYKEHWAGSCHYSILKTWCSIEFRLHASLRDVFS